MTVTPAKFDGIYIYLLTHEESHANFFRKAITVNELKCKKPAKKP